MECLSCEWIESRVVLGIDDLKFCCIPHSKDKGFVPIGDYAGGPLPVDEILEARRALRELNNKKGDSPCKGCHFLKRKDWAAERKSDALLDTIYISNFKICNLRCRYCFVYLFEGSAQPNISYTVLPILQDLLENGHLAEDSLIEWGGGEPTILPEFAEVEQMLLKAGHRQQIATSGVKFSEEIEEGLRADRLTVVTSIDAGNRETYLAVKGRDHFEVVWENVARYVKTGGAMRIKYILRTGNADAANIRQFIRKCKEIGAREVVLTPDMRELSQETLTEKTIYGFALMIREGKKHGVPIVIRDEYVGPKTLEVVSKYVTLRKPAWRYRLFVLAAFVKDTARAARRKGHRFLNLLKTRTAIKAAGSLRGERLIHPFQLLEGPRRESQKAVLRLLDYQTKNPNRVLRDRLTEIVRSNGVIPKQKVAKTAVAVGVTGDAWTADGNPGYLIVDGTSSKKPLVQELYFTCPPGPVPMRLTISDGTNPDVVHKFLEPERIKIALPAVPAGETGVFSVQTDKTWLVTQDEGDKRRYGVQITNYHRM